MTISPVAGLTVADTLHAFLIEDVLPGTGLDADTFFHGFARIVTEFEPRIESLLQRREALQADLDTWHKAHPEGADPSGYQRLLRDNGYLVDQPDAVMIDAGAIDPGAIDPVVIDLGAIDRELATVAAPQLLSPLDDLQGAIDAVNARWGSLFDALHESAAVPSEPGGDVDDTYNRTRIGAYDDVRRERVGARVASALDEFAPLIQGSHADVQAYRILAGALRVRLNSGSDVGLKQAGALVGYRGETAAPTSILLGKNGLHLEIVIDRDAPASRRGPAGVSDVLVESVLSVVQDCEDSVVCVDVDDKVGVYRNWLHLMKPGIDDDDAAATRASDEADAPADHAGLDSGCSSRTKPSVDIDLGDGVPARRHVASGLEETGSRAVRSVKLARDRNYLSPDGSRLTLTGRAVMLVRHVGMHRTSDAVLRDGGSAINESLLDLVVTTLCAKHDGLIGEGKRRNSQAGNLYIVRPKMHGPDEVELAVDLFEAVERELTIPQGTLKLGLVVEESRTSLNLAGCLAAARQRLFMVQPDIVDRMADEIRTHTMAGPVWPDSDPVVASWLAAGQRHGLTAGSSVGLAGASPTTVPSTVAATLHALRCQAIDVGNVHPAMAATPVAALLPDNVLIRKGGPFTIEDAAGVLDQTAHALLRHLVHRVHHGVGYVSVLDSDEAARKEDGATLRCATQLLVNWRLHGVVSDIQLRDALERMALVVDRQNAGREGYLCLVSAFDDSIAFRAAVALVLSDRHPAERYDDAVLTHWRRAAKALGK